IRLAQVSGLRGARRRPCDETADPRLSWSRRDRSRRPQREARARRHPRDRIFRPDPAIDCRRSQPGAALSRNPAAARRLCPTRLGQTPPVPGARAELDAAYRFLRTVEHRLQMVADEQTHTLPTERTALEHFARFMGFTGRDSFASVLLTHLRNVQRHYANLFEAPPSPPGAR